MKLTLASVSLINTQTDEIVHDIFAIVEESISRVGTKLGTKPIKGLRALLMGCATVFTNQIVALCRGIRKIFQSTKGLPATGIRFNESWRIVSL